MFQRLQTLHKERDGRYLEMLCLRMGTVAAEGLGSISVGIDSRIHLVGHVAVVRSISILGGS